MTNIILPIVLLVIMLIFGGVFLVVTKKQERVAGNKKNQVGNSKADTKHEVKKEDIFKFMEFDKILDDMIVQKNGTRYVMAIKCKGINYDLMSDVEQLSVEEGFITFLNTLRYPIQLYVQAQNIDLKNAITEYKSNIVTVRDEFDKLDKEYNKVSEAFDSTKEDVEKIEVERNSVLNVYEYAMDIINYVEKMSTNKGLLQRNFYVLVAYNISEITARDTFTKEEVINICYTELLTRCQTVMSGLSACSVESKVLNSNEIADLLYTAYNRDDKGVMSVREAINSGFYRLYSTSEDVFYKKHEKLQKEVEEEARLRALEVLKYSIDKGTYVSEKQEQLDVIEEISREATNMIAREDLPQEIKIEAQQTLLNDYKVLKKELLQQIDQENEETIESLKELEKHPERSNGLEKQKQENSSVPSTLEKADDGIVKENIEEEKKSSDLLQDTATEIENYNVNIPKNIIIDDTQETENKDSIFFDDRLGLSSEDEDESII